MVPQDLVSPMERYRVRAGLGVNEAAVQAGVDRKTLRNIERGRREPLGPIVRKLAVLYGVDAGDLLAEIRAFRADRQAA